MEQLTNKTNFEDKLRLLPESSWLETSVRDLPERIIKWFPILNINDKNFGISTNGNWVVCGENGLFEAIPEKLLIPFFPFLEITWEKICSLVRAKITDENLSEIIIQSFPYEELILSALSSEMFYWTRLSLLWVGTRSFSSQEKLSTCLQTLIENKEVPQDIRHKAFRILKNIK